MPCQGGISSGCCHGFLPDGVRTPELFFPQSITISLFQKATRIFESTDYLRSVWTVQTKHYSKTIFWSSLLWNALPKKPTKDRNRCKTNQGSYYWLLLIFKIEGILFFTFGHYWWYARGNCPSRLKLHNGDSLEQVKHQHTDTNVYPHQFWAALLTSPNPKHTSWS